MPQANSCNQAAHVKNQCVCCSHGVKRSENRIAIKRLSLAHRKQVTFTKALVNYESVENCCLLFKRSTRSNVEKPGWRSIADFYGLCRWDSFPDLTVG